MFSVDNLLVNCALLFGVYRVIGRGILRGSEESFLTKSKKPAGTANERVSAVPASRGETTVSDNRYPRHSIASYRRAPHIFAHPLHRLLDCRWCGFPLKTPREIREREHRAVELTGLRDERSGRWLTRQSYRGCEIASA
jgi:hypothetical protein